MKKRYVVAFVLVIGLVAYAIHQVIPPESALDRLVFDREPEKRRAFLGLLARIPVVLILLYGATGWLDRRMQQWIGGSGNTIRENKHRIVMWYLMVETVLVSTFIF